MLQLEQSIINLYRITVLGGVAHAVAKIPLQLH
jgi:hypothetical protein